MKDLENKFSVVEKRVKAIVEENADLRKRISELERELGRVRRESQEAENFHGKKMRIREKIERILHALESVSEKK